MMAEESEGSSSALAQEVMAVSEAICGVKHNGVLSLPYLGRGALLPCPVPL